MVSFSYEEAEARIALIKSIQRAQETNSIVNHPVTHLG
jgi:hypothetical protein